MFLFFLQISNRPGNEIRLFYYYQFKKKRIIIIIIFIYKENRSNFENDTHTQTDEGELKRKKKFEFWDDDRKNLFLLNFVDLFSLLVFAHFWHELIFVFF